MNYAWNKIYRRSLFESIKYPVGKKWEDIGATYKLIDKSKMIVWTSRELYYYVQREGSITSSNELINVLDQFELAQERYIWLKSRYQSLDNIMKTQLCVISYNCWSFLQSSTKERTSDERRRAKKCIDYLDTHAKMQLKAWEGYSDYKSKIILYLHFRTLLGAVIRQKRRKMLS